MARLWRGQVGCGQARYGDARYGKARYGIFCGEGMVGCSQDWLGLVMPGQV